MNCAGSVFVGQVSHALFFEFVCLTNLNNWIIFILFYFISLNCCTCLMSRNCQPHSHTHSSLLRASSLRTVGTFRGHLASAISSGTERERERHIKIFIINNTIKRKKLLLGGFSCILLEFCGLSTYWATSWPMLPLGQLVYFWLSAWAACLAIWLLSMVLPLLLHIAAKRIGVRNFW